MTHSIPGRRIILALFLVFLLLPIYWLVNMSFKTNTEIVSTMTLWPHQPTIENYKIIFTDESWYSGYINSLKYVIINTVISILVALPAALIPRRSSVLMVVPLGARGRGGVPAVTELSFPGGWIGGGRSE